MIVQRSDKQAHEAERVPAGQPHHDDGRIYTVRDDTEEVARGR